MKIFTKFNANILLTCVLAAFVMPRASIAQDHCGTDEMYKIRLKNNPELKKKEQEANKLAMNPPSQISYKSGGVTVIPIVFHIMHQYGAENIPKERILTEVDSLNKCYRGHNGDTNLIRKQFKHLIGDCNIEFRLAKLDPNGNCTDGIDRVYTTQTTNADDNIKSLDDWDPTKYFNVWVVSAINSSSVPPGEYILGYSTFPWDASNSPSTDGVIIRADQIGTGSKTLVHEAGHYFGLFHPFQGGCGSDCNDANSGGDGICDTPPTSAENFNCAETDNACGNDTPMTENYMDYSKCSYLFTTDQASRIATYLPTYRSSQYSSSNLTATGVDGSYNPVYCSPKADFYSSTAITCPNKTVQFFNASYNGPVTSYYWTFPDATPNTSTDSSPVVSYVNPGVYSVSLIARNQEGYDIKTKNSFITVLSDSNKLLSPVFEGFETTDPPTAGWKFPQNMGKLGEMNFKVSSAAANKGTYSLELQNRYGRIDSTYYFIMPPVDISKVTNYKLTFSYAFAKSATSNTDEFLVQVSQDCGATYQNILIHPNGAFTSTSRIVTSNLDFIPDSTEWKQASASFSNYSLNKELYFKFSIKNGGGNNIYIDNINIGNYTSGINNKAPETNNVEVYPNPVTSQITININAAQNVRASIEAFDMAGRKLEGLNNIDVAAGGQELTYSTAQLNISAPGMYYLKISTGSSISIKKIIVAK